MRTLVWSATFIRSFKKATRRNPELKERAECTLRLLVEDIFHPALHTHKLKGDLAGVWACTVDYDYRLIFEMLRNSRSGEEEILLISMGTHEEVY